jgi:5,10-methylenetetrahydromethanopterin reductase
VQAATGNRLAIGLGVGHAYVMASRGLPFERPAAYMEEYLRVLSPLLTERTVDVTGERVSGHLSLDVPLEVPAPPVIVAALGPRMLRIAGELADGTVVWLTGVRTVAEHIVPGITAAASDAGRPPPRIIASLPVCLTDEPVAARALADEHYGFYNAMPSYRAMLDREGADAPADVAIIGDEAQVAAGVQRLADAGATDFLARIFGTDEEREQTLSFLGLLAAF